MTPRVRALSSRVLRARLANPRTSAEVVDRTLGEVETRVAPLLRVFAVLGTIQQQQPPGRVGVPSLRSLVLMPGMGGRHLSARLAAAAGEVLPPWPHSQEPIEVLRDVAEAAHALTVAQRTTLLAWEEMAVTHAVLHRPDGLAHLDVHLRLPAPAGDDAAQEPQRADPSHDPVPDPDAVGGAGGPARLSVAAQRLIALVVLELLGGEGRSAADAGSSTGPLARPQVSDVVRARVIQVAGHLSPGYAARAMADMHWVGLGDAQIAALLQHPSREVRQAVLQRLAARAPKTRPGPLPGPTTDMPRRARRGPSR